MGFSMKKIKIVLLGLAITKVSLAAGYKIPEQSLKSTGTAGTYFSSAYTADSSFYNPANMSFMEDKKFIEIGLRYINLPKINFKGQAFDPVTHTFVISNAQTKSEQFFIPYFHFVSSSFVKNARLGISFVTPAGLSKRWTAKTQKATAEEFTLEVYELDTSVSYKFTEKFSIGLTGRLVYAKGRIKYQVPQLYRISMEGNSSPKLGWGISASYRLKDNWNISTIYRSKVYLDVSGRIKGYLGSINPIAPDGGDTSIPLPAEWKVGTSYKMNNTTLEFTFERTFWSSYKKLDFNFANPAVEQFLGKPIPKNWKDSNTYRFGIYHRFNNKFLLTSGIAYDKTPIPEKTLGFELPDSDGYIFSLGGIYSPHKNLEFGIAGLYAIKKDRNVHNTKIRGKFSHLKAYLIDVSVGYKF